MSATPRQRLVQAARSVGATVAWNAVGNQVSADVDAPPGQVWQANGCHMLSDFVYKGSASWVDEMVRDLVERIGHGLEPCPDPACELCHEDDEP